MFDYDSSRAQAAAREVMAAAAIAVGRAARRSHTARAVYAGARAKSSGAELHVHSRLAQAGCEVDAQYGSLTPAIHLSTTFERDENGGYERGFVYSRSNNPTRALLERTVHARATKMPCDVGCLPCTRRSVKRCLK